MRQKLLFIDCETTGTNPELNDIYELAYIIDIDGEVEYEEKIHIRPFDFANIQQEALDLNGHTIEDLKKFDTSVKSATDHLKQVWSIYIDKYDRNDKFVVAGYNTSFDKNFLYEAFKKAGDKYGLGSWCFWPAIDIAGLVAAHVLKFGLRLDDYKLQTVANHYGLEFKPHDSLEDIRVTRELFYILEGVM